MPTWKDSLTTLLTCLTCSPDRPAEMHILTIVGLLGLVIAVKLVAGRFGFKFTPMSRVLIVVVAWVALTVTAVITVRIYAVPSIASDAIALAVQIAAAVLVALIVVIPLQCWLLKGSYMEGIISSVFSVIVAVLIVVVVRGCWHVVTASKVSIEREMGRQDTMQKELTR